MLIKKNRVYEWLRKTNEMILSVIVIINYANLNR